MALNRWSVIIILIAILFLHRTPVYGSTIKMCVEHWPPYTVVDGGKVVGGLTVELTSQALTRIGHTLKIDYVPWRRCLSMVRSGERDAVADASASQHKEFNFVTGTNMSSLWTLAAWVRKHSPMKAYFSMNDFQGKTVGLVLDYDYPEVIKKFNGWKKDVAINDRLNMKKLANGRFDLAVSDIINTLAVIKEENLDLRYLEPPIVTDPLFVAFHSGKKELAQKYDESFGSMIKDGTVDQLYLKHTGMKYTQLKGSVR